MKITRRQVLEAIRYENLTPGNFFLETAKDPKRCEVCAVGAILRRAGVRPSTISDRAWKLLALSELIKGVYGTILGRAGADGDEKAALSNSNYLLALSIKFEQLYIYHAAHLSKVRAELSEFVKSNFPKEFTTLGK